jgi:hypothetical protein
MSDAMVCRCEEFVHPRAIFNPPGRTALDYRIGDFLRFRHALLLARPGETRLTHWRPGASHDLAVQLVEWWAYLADVLTFYNERTMAQAFVRTADDAEALRNLTRILGYRPRPGIGARGVVALLLTGNKPVALPRGFPVESKPGPGKEPLMFESDADTLLGSPDAVTAEPVPDGSAVVHNTVLLRGKVSTLTLGERLLLVKRDWSAPVIVTVQAVVQEQRNTRVAITGATGVAGLARDYRLVRSTQSARARDSSSSQVELDSVQRSIEPGMPVVIERSAGAPVVAGVTAVSENTYSISSGLQAPHPTTIPILFTVLDITNGVSNGTVVRFGWTDAGELTATPTASIQSSSAQVLASLDAAKPRTVLVEDALGRGSSATAQNESGAIRLTNLEFPLIAPLQLFTNLVAVSRGKTVVDEVLGNGDASLAGQEFVLRNAPVTYLAGRESRSGDGYSSTIRIHVNSIEWHEARSFFGQPADARVFVTFEDAEGKTHVKTGDGINGARLPSGTDNVVASYRFGSGAEVPEAGALSNIVKPWPGVRAIHAPVPPGAGEDPEPPARLRELAPRSVLTFDRAVSASDYEIIAAAAPGVRRVRATWSFNAAEQRAMLRLSVGDDAAAVTSARAAVTGVGERDNVPVIAATRIDVAASLVLVIDPDYTPDTVIDAVRAALLDVFDAKHARIGRPLYRSAINAACLGVAGTIAVRDFTLRTNPAPTARTFGPRVYTGFRFHPGDDGFFVLAAADVAITTEAAPHG